MIKLNVNKRLLSFVFALGLTVYPFLTRGETASREYVYVFCDANISSNQYGASQTAFERDSLTLMNDNLIWEELQKYFPVNDFKNSTDAKNFYVKYFLLISKYGCGYAAVANSVFQAFEGKEDEFEEAFGYSMYKKDANDYVDFNYEVFILKLFNFYNIDKCHRQNYIVNLLMNDDETQKIEELKEITGYSEFLPENYRFLNKEEKRKWFEESVEKKDEYDRLYEEWKNSNKDEEISLGVPCDPTFGYLKDYLKKYNINCNIKCNSYVHNYSVGDIVACSGFDLYQLDSNSNIIASKYDINLHYVYVTEVTQDGTIIVSSWGNKYILDIEGVKNIQKVLVKVKS